MMRRRWRSERSPTCEADSGKVPDYNDRACPEAPLICTTSERIVPIVPDEARTFGMEGMFRQLGIYSSAGQLYDPADSNQVMFYKEDRKGQMLEEGITESGALMTVNGTRIQTTTTCQEIDQKPLFEPADNFYMTYLDMENKLDSQTLPVLPLRDIVVFPSMVIPLFVGRDKSISALNEVMKKDLSLIHI